jgi:hypothetical protein
MTMSTENQKAPKRAPDLVGTHASVWVILPTAAEMAAAPATMNGCLVHAPGSHPYWPWKVICLQNLADFEGSPPAIKTYPRAAFEMCVISLDPSHALGDPDNSGPWRLLTPPDVIHQFDGVDVAGARVVFDMAVAAVAHGQLVPDSDYRPHWATVLDNYVRHVGGQKYAQN